MLAPPFSPNAVIALNRDRASIPECSLNLISSVAIKASITFFDISSYLHDIRLFSDKKYVPKTTPSLEII